VKNRFSDGNSGERRGPLFYLWVQINDHGMSGYRAVLSRAWGKGGSFLLRQSRNQQSADLGRLLERSLRL
jgi:hypothetical protein